MLRKETVAPDTLELLKQLMQDDHLKDFILVGGTVEFIIRRFFNIPALI